MAVEAATPCRMSISTKMRVIRDQFLTPGSVAIARPPGLLSTIVSTGVAACLWDPVAGLGGMAHFVLPDGSHGLRACEPALDRLLEELLRLGARRERVSSRLCGGGRSALAAAGGPGLGEMNVAAAERWLHARGIAIAGRQCGEPVALRVHFSPLNGNSRVEPVTACCTPPAALSA